MADIIERVDSKGRTRYQARVRIEGAKPRFKTFDRKTDARKWAAKEEARIIEGRDFPEREAARTTLGDLIERYLRDVIPLKKDAKKQRQQLAWWKARLGSLAVPAVTPDVVAQARNALSTELVPSASNSKKAPSG